MVSHVGVRRGGLVSSLSLMVSAVPESSWFQRDVCFCPFECIVIRSLSVLWV